MRQATEARYKVLRSAAQYFLLWSREDVMAVEVVMMTEAEARAATDKITVDYAGLADRFDAVETKAKDALVEMSQRLMEIKDREGWRALNYRSWTKYIEGEFTFMPERSVFRLINFGREFTRLRAAGADTSNVTPTSVARAQRALPVTSVDRERIEDYDEARQVADDDDASQLPDEERRQPTSRGLARVLDAITLIVDEDIRVLDGITPAQRREYEFTFEEAIGRIHRMAGTTP